METLTVVVPSERYFMTFQWFVALCLLALGGCADLSEPLPEQTSVQVEGPYTPLPSASPNVASSEPNASTVTPVTMTQKRLPPANWRNGLALRWQGNANRCIARQNPTPTPNELLTLSSCANSNQQAWTLANGRLAADGNLCVGIGGNSNRLLMLPCSGPNILLFYFNGGNVYDVNLTSSPTYLYLDSNTGDAGSPIIGYQSSTTFASNKASWNFTGVGTSLGAPFAFGGDANLCLRHEQGQLKLRPCAPADANQRWSFLQGDLANTANNCVISSPSLPSLAIVPCSSVSNTAGNNQGWYWYEFLRYAMTDQNGIYVLARAVQGDLSAVELTPKDYNPRPKSWHIGGHLEDAPP